MNKDMFCVDIKGLVFDKSGRVMLLREPDGVWDLPGGMMEHGENAHETLIRECREEVGVRCTILDERPMVIWSIYFDPMDVWFAYLCFRIEFDNYDFQKSDEYCDYDFFNAKDLEKIRIKKSIRPLKKWLQQNELTKGKGTESMQGRNAIEKL